jgi:hypothetical protein
MQIFQTSLVVGLNIIGASADADAREHLKGRS